MVPLYLTAAEQKTFSALPDALRDGWVVEEETEVFVDSPASRRSREELIRVRNPHLADVQRRLAAAESEQEAGEVVQSFDIASLTEEDLLQLFFALGPESVSVLLGAVLAAAREDRDLEVVAALGNLRHLFLATKPVSLL
ncbi:MAG: hypothetical protein WCS85_00930 [Candidatus Peribacteraceae bacterium]